jgi:hypothetical protein
MSKLLVVLNASYTHWRLLWRSQLLGTETVPCRQSTADCRCDWQHRRRNRQRNRVYVLTLQSGLLWLLLLPLLLHWLALSLLDKVRICRGA